MSAAASALKREPILVNKKLPIAQYSSAKLAEILCDMGVVPFTKESVEKYKKAKLLELDGENRAGFLVRHPGLAALALVFSALVGVLFFAAPDPAWTGGALGVLGGIIGLLVVARMSDVATDEENSFGWERVPFAQYGNVPESVFAQVERIEEKMMLVQFRVEYLVRMKDRKVFDPFLIVKYAECEYYIEVWDETSFDGKSLT